MLRLQLIFFFFLSYPSENEEQQLGFFGLSVITFSNKNRTKLMLASKNTSNVGFFFFSQNKQMFNLPLLFLIIHRLQNSFYDKKLQSGGRTEGIFQQFPGLYSEMDSMRSNLTKPQKNINFSNIFSELPSSRKKYSIQYNHYQYTDCISHRAMAKLEKKVTVL